MSHNTLTVDGCEQNRFDPKCLFAIDSKVEPEVREWKSSADLDLLEAAYTLELRDGTEATHERRFVFLKAHGLWLIRDRVIGAGQHRIETRFHFAEGTEIASAGDRAYRTLFNPGPNLFLIALGADPTTTQVDQGWVSATYGVKRPIRVLRFIKSIQLPFEQEYILAPTKSDASHKELPVSELEGLRRMASQLVL